MAISYTIASHAWGMVSKVLASHGGKHIYNIQFTTDTDNTNIVAKGDYISLDLYAEATQSDFSAKVVDKAANGNFYVEIVNPYDALFVYQKPLIEEEYSNKFKKESNFYNPAGTVGRCYELAKGDVVEVSANGFDGTVEVGSTITGIVGKKMHVYVAPANGQE